MLSKQDLLIEAVQMLKTYIAHLNRQAEQPIFFDDNTRLSNIDKQRVQALINDFLEKLHQNDSIDALQDRITPNKLNAHLVALQEHIRQTTKETTTNAPQKGKTLLSIVSKIKLDSISYTNKS
ncbi:MAG: hypothetical protein R3E91_03210 [Chlamydiales bacterium]